MSAISCHDQRPLEVIREVMLSAAADDIDTTSVCIVLMDHIIQLEQQVKSKTRSTQSSYQHFLDSYDVTRREHVKRDAAHSLLTESDKQKIQEFIPACETLARYAYGHATGKQFHSAIKKKLMLSLLQIVLTSGLMHRI